MAVPAPRNATGPDTLNDLGNLLLAFVMLWAYMQFSQFLIIWSGNLKEEIPWYLSRTRHGWEWPAVALIIFLFVLPFLRLLSRETKRRGERLARLAALIVVMDWLADLLARGPVLLAARPANSLARPRRDRGHRRALDRRIPLAPRPEAPDPGPPGGRPGFPKGDA